MNKDLLEYEMKIRKKTVDDMCKMLGISKSAWYRKVACKTQFALNEIQKIIEYLELDSPVEIFFPKEVS